MSENSSNYERHLTEIQSLKKQLTAEKISHETTLKQLQSTHSIIETLKNALKSEQQSGHAIKAQITEKQGKIENLTRQYEEQIAIVKNMIDMKDQEIRKIRSVLMVNDYDVIRLKVVNEMQIQHRQQVQQLLERLRRVELENRQVKCSHELVLEKYGLVNQHIKEMQQDQANQQEESSSRYIKELNQVYDNYQKQKNQKRFIQKKYDQLLQKYELAVEHHRHQCKQLELELRNQNNSLAGNGGSSKNKLEKYYQQSRKLKDELYHERELAQNSENQLRKVKRQNQELGRKERDLLQKNVELEQEVDHLKALRDK